VKSTIRRVREAIRRRRFDGSGFAIALWALLFIGSHLVISSRVVRLRLTAPIGERAYPRIYSLVALATFIPLCFAFARHKRASAMP